MNTSVELFEGVIVLLALIVLAMILKKMNLLEQEHSKIFSKLVMKITLPALIFSSLATTHFNEKYLIMALIMAVVEIACISLAYFIARILRMKKDETGALILVSAFGMSTMLGYPLISEIYPGSSQAMEEAVITSEFGVGFLLFIFGPIIAMYFGTSKVIGADLLKSVKAFFFSPIFISLVAGILVSFIPFNENARLFKTFDQFLVLVSNANTLLVALTVGLIVEIRHVKKYYLFLIIAIGIKLLIKPVLAYFLIQNPHFTDMMKEIVFIETAMPSALLAAVLAKHYNCRPELISMTIVSTLILSIPSVSVLFLMLFNK